MTVTLKNIQGFRGDFTYTIEPGLNVITSMFNGTGKTTFFECLKFLHNPGSLDKTNRKFLLNKNEHKGVFVITVEECSFGFILEGDQYSLVSKLKGEEVFTYSQTPHPMLNSYTHVFFTEESFINICDRFLNLFSSSHTVYNHELVKSFLTSPFLEKANELISIEKISAQRSYDEALNNLNHYNDMLKISYFYPNLEQFKKALDCEDTLVYYESLDEVLQLLRRCTQSKPFIEVEAMNELMVLWGVLDSIKIPAKEIDTSVIDSLLELSGILKDIRFEYPVIETNSLENLAELYPSLMEIKPAFPIIEVDYLQELADIYGILITLLSNFKKINYHKKEMAKISGRIKWCEHSCPIKGTVYIVGGVCLSAENASW